MFRSGLILAAFLAVFILIPGAHAALVVPSGLAGVEGSTHNSFPFDTDAFGMRYQQVYDSSEFVAGPMLISAISFRPDGNIGDAFTTLFSNIRIDLSTTSAAVDGLSTTFANNIGADVQTVLNGSVSVSSADTGAGPRDFDITFIFANPFFYDPTLGNLLLDVFNYGGGISTPFDAHDSDLDGISRVFSLGSANALNGTAGTMGLVTQFEFQGTGTDTIPEPSTIVLMGFGLVGLAIASRRRKNS